MAHVSIDYDEGVADSYRGVVLKQVDEEKRWATGDPQKDWSDYIDHASENGLLVSESSSITHFLMDVPGWRMILDQDDIEMIVPEDRPERDAHHHAAPGQVFRDIHGDLLRLDKSVPGDATQWVVERWNDGWSSDGEIVETADLAEISADPEDKAPQP